MALSDTKLRKIQGRPYSGPAEITDGDGLSVRVSPKGVVAFQWRYYWAGKQQRITLGRYPALSLQDARIRAGELRLMVERGQDPKGGVNDSAMLTVDDCIDKWLEMYVDRQLKRTTRGLYHNQVNLCMRGLFLGRAAESIEAKEWAAFINGLEQENLKKARRVLVTFKALFSWCESRHLVGDVKISRLRPRDYGKKADDGKRVLSFEELAHIWVAMERGRAGGPVKMLHQMTMLWGNRLSELRMAEPHHFQLNTGLWVCPAELSKMGNVITRPIFEQIRPMLDRMLDIYPHFIFPGSSLDKPITIAAANKMLRVTREELPYEYWRAHDFRRSLATHTSAAGVPPHVVERMLGHELGGVMAIYNKHDWIEEQRRAYEDYADKLLWHVRKAGGRID